MSLSKPPAHAQAGLALAAAAGLNRCLLTAYLFLGANGIVSHSPTARPWPFAFAYAAIELAAGALALLLWLRASGPAAASRHQFAELPWSRAFIAGALLACALATANTTTQLTPPPLALALLVLTTALASTLPLFTSPASASGNNANKMTVLALAAGVLVLSMVHAPVLNLWSLVSALSAVALALLFVALPWATLTSLRTLTVASALLALVALVSGVLSATTPLPSPLGNGALLAINAAVLVIALRFGSSSSSAVGLGSASAFLLASLIAVTAWGIPTDAFAVHPIATALAYALIYLPAGLLVYSHYRAGYASVAHVRVHDHEERPEGDMLFKMDPIIMPALSDNDDDDGGDTTNVHSPMSDSAPAPSAARRGSSASSALPSPAASTWFAAILGGIFALSLSQILYVPVIPGADPCANLLFERQHPEPRPGTKVLVTGGSGFIGSNLVELLLDLGYKVRVLDNLSTGYFHNIAHLVDHPQFEFQLGDILDLPAVEKAVDGVDYVYHLAAMSKVAPSMKDPKMAKYCLETNSLGTINVLNVSRALRVKKVVYAASSTYYGNGKTPMREDAAPDLLTPYSSSKYEGEIQMDIYDRIFGLPTVSIRFMMVFGPRQPTSGAYAIVTGVFVKKLQDNQPLPIEGDGSHFRDFVHVRDIGETLILAQQHPTLRNEVINSGTGVGHSVHEVADLVSPNHKHVAPRKNDLVGTLADTCKAKRMLGFKAKYDFVHEMSKIIADAKHPERVTVRPEFQQLARNLTAAPWLLPPQSLQYLFKPHVKDLAKAAAAAVSQPDFVKKSPKGADETSPDAKSLVVIPYTKATRPLVEHSLYTVVAHGRAPHVLLVAQDTQDATNDCTLLNAACYDAQGAPLTRVVAQLLDLDYTVHVVRPGTAYVRQVWRSFRPLLATTGAKMVVPQGFRPSEGLWQYVALPEARALVDALANAEEADQDVDKVYTERAHMCGTRGRCEAAAAGKVAVAMFKPAYECLQSSAVSLKTMCSTDKHVVYFDPACVDQDAGTDEVVDKLKAAKVWWMAEGTCPETAEVCIGVPKRLLKFKEPGEEEGALTCVGDGAVLVAA